MKLINRMDAYHKITF